MRISSVVLSGGKSSRMGTNKSLLKLDEKPVISHIIEEMQTLTDDVFIITNDPQIYTFTGLSMFSDRYKGKGPLAGLESAFYHIPSDVFLIAACDMPFIHHRVYTYLLKYLDDYDAVIPIYDTQTHPLVGIYRRSVHSHIQEQLVKNELRVKSFFNNINIKYIDDFGSISEETLKRHFFNMNNPDEYERAKSL